MKQDLLVTILHVSNHHRRTRTLSLSLQRLLLKLKRKIVLKISTRQLVLQKEDRVVEGLVILRIKCLKRS